jgi:hypothetical protein
MQKVSTPSFDEWVEYCFTQGYPDFHSEYGSPGYDAVEARTERFVRLDPTVLATYMVQLFRSPGFVADRYSDDQIGDAVWFLFGCASEYFKDLYYPYSAAISPSLQIDAISAVATLYTDLFDHVCCKRRLDPDGYYTNDLRVDIAVWMIWDMDNIEGAVIFPEKTPHLVEPGFAVLDTVLANCRTSSCQMSALHGLGHIHAYHPQRTERMIDDFLANRPAAEWVREFALTARTGHIQ